MWLSGPVPQWLIVLSLVAAVAFSAKVRQQIPPQLQHLYYSRNLGQNKYVSSDSTWSPWSTWSPCSRTCGGGISTQTRECKSDRNKNNLSNSLSGSDKSAKSPYVSSCVGQYKRYQFCKTKPCRGLQKDFRIEQCSAFNSKPYMGRYYRWEPFYQAPNVCELKCRPKGELFFATLSKAVIDGTPCHPNVKDKFCIGGMCKSVGCDGVIGSKKKWDHCGVCGGNNSTCRIVSGIYTMPQLSYGYNLIATIPKGACNINITELQPSPNYLALRNLNGTYILNGNWAINWSGSYDAAGTLFDYRRSDNAKELEQLIAKGPTQDSVDIMILYQQRNPGIKYEYTLPLRDGPDQTYPSLVKMPNHLNPANPDYGPDVGQHSAPASPHHHSSRGSRAGRHSNSRSSSTAAATSGHHGAVKTHHLRNPADNRHKQTTLRGDKNEATVSDPALLDDVPALVAAAGDDRSERTRSRAIQHGGGQSGNDKVSSTPGGGSGTGWTSQHFWNSSGFSECSRSCGGGSRKNVIVCVKNSTLAVVGNHNCDPLTRPETQTIRCNTHSCPPEWVMGDWSQCSATCGNEGIQSRTVQCQTGFSPTLQITVDERLCPSPRPELPTRTCPSKPCIFWKAGDWGECSASCGKGRKLRRVACVDGSGLVVTDTLCSKEDQPTSEETCHGQLCTANMWVFTDWSSECFGDCGIGNQSRSVACLSDTRDSPGRCDALTKPQSFKSCNNDKSCQGKWFTGPWQQCSASCGEGVQTREAFCLLSYRGQYKISPDSSCAESPKPALSQPCSLHRCKPMWYTTEWSQCSQSCNIGVQERIIRCLDESLNQSDGCDNSKRPEAKQSCRLVDCNIDHQRDSGCVNTLTTCSLVVQSRLCRYPYYRNVCCDSCHKHKHTDQ